MAYKKKFKAFRDAHPRSVQVLGWVDEKDELLHSADWICCAILNVESYCDIPHHKMTNIKWVLSGHQHIREEVTEEQSKKWIDYLVNRSPYASAFVVKDHVIRIQEVPIRPNI